MVQNWIHKNLRQNGSPAINVTRVSSSQLMSELCVSFEKPSFNPNFGTLATLAVGTDRSEQQI